MQRKRGFQFGLRPLLFVTAFIAVSLAWIFWDDERTNQRRDLGLGQWAAIEQLREVRFGIPRSGFEGRAVWLLVERSPSRFRDNYLLILAVESPFKNWKGRPKWNEPTSAFLVADRPYRKQFRSRPSEVEIRDHIEASEAFMTVLEVHNGSQVRLASDPQPEK